MTRPRADVPWRGDNYLHALHNKLLRNCFLSGDWNDMDRTENGANPIMQFFAYEHLPAGPMRKASQSVCELAIALAGDIDIPNGAEKSAGMRKLLEAKDCFVRAALAKKRGEL